MPLLDHRQLLRDEGGHDIEGEDQKGDNYEGEECDMQHFGFLSGAWIKSRVARFRIPETV
jgi:hypothetical protein